MTYEVSLYNFTTFIHNEVSYEQAAIEHSIAFKAIHIESKEDAQNAPTPITTYALFYNGEYLTNEQMNEAKFLKLSAH